MECRLVKCSEYNSGRCGRILIEGEMGSYCNFNPRRYDDGSVDWSKVGPELLEALEKAEQQLDYGQHAAALSIIRSAIAKARGE